MPGYDCVDTNGAVYADGGLCASGADFAESVAVRGGHSDYETGDVVDAGSIQHRAVQGHCREWAIARGDLLVTYSLPSYAMKGTNRRPLVGAEPPAASKMKWVPLDKREGCVKDKLVLADSVLVRFLPGDSFRTTLAS